MGNTKKLISLLWKSGFAIGGGACGIYLARSYYVEMNTTKDSGQQLLKLLPFNAPLLHQKAETVNFPLSAADNELIANMLYSAEDSQMAAKRGPWSSAAGMAAPQWGASRRIFVIRRLYLPPERHLDGLDCPLGGNENFLVVINPEYIGLTPNDLSLDDDVNNGDEEKDHVHVVEKTAGTVAKEVLGTEVCFSVPRMKGVVRRYQTIAARFSSMDGTRHLLILNNFAARVFQHETDHTEGRLYIDAGRCSRLETIKKN